MKINIKHIAKLANLTITPHDEDKYEKQLTEIISYIEKLNEVKTDDVKPTAQVTGLVSVTRKDGEVRPSLTQDEALKNTKSKYNGLFKVKAILDEK